MNRSKILGFTVGPIGSAILGFATLPVMAWFFSVEDIGRISMLQIVCSFAVIFFCLGLDQAYVREYHETEDKPSLLKTVSAPGLLLLTVVSLGFIFYDPGLLSRVIFSLDSSALSILLACCLLTTFISRFLSLILRIQEKGLAFSMSQVLPKALFLFIIGVYIFLKVGFSFEKLIIAYVLSMLAVMLIYAWNTRTEWLPAVGKSIDKQKLGTMLQFGLPLIFGGMASWALMAMDKLFLRSLSTFEELGIYSIAVSVASAAGIFSGVFTTIWAPTVYKWAAEGINPEKINQISEHVLAAAFFIFTLSGMFSWALQFLLPSTYDNVQYLVTACMAVPLLYALSETTAVGIGIARKTSYSMAASFIAAAINFAGNYWLTPIYGAAGAATSTAVAFWIFLVCRTELSCLVWRKIPRLKLYGATFTCLLAAVSTSMIGEDHQVLMITAWTAIGIAGILCFKNSLSAARVEMQRHIKVKTSSQNI
ncbi:lipopolysaccharide biosynthesis protein [Pseudomonas sp. A-B-19]|uniref:lipopolysaccharide biosynthesis protein n=1 Tax=Pseudomonas sp. A-B-19 TaxID=2832405 RepID=UPI001CBCA505|nr:oligosaccharide flippase family protein [Pseudomonas sp. A-B-19]